MKLSSRKFNKISKVTLIVISGISCLYNHTFAQTEPPSQIVDKVSKDPATRDIQQCIKLMEQRSWQDALDIMNQLIAKNKGLGVETHGAKFGTCYYYRGLCLAKLAQKTQNEVAANLYESAIQSFNQCFAINPPNDSSNTYRAKSILLRGNAEQALKRYQSAINSYTKFLNERNTGRDTYNLSEFDINLAICTWKNVQDKQDALIKLDRDEDIQYATTLIQQALLHSGKNSPSPQALIAALNTLSEIAASINDDNLVPTAIERIKNTNPDNLDITRESEKKNDPENLITLSGNIKKLSQLILKTSIQNLPNTSHKLTAIFPGMQRYATVLNNTKTATPDSKATNTTLQNIDQQSIINVLKARAISLLKSNEPELNHSAVAIHQIIVTEFPNSTDFVNNYYNLIHAAAQSSHAEDAKLVIKLAPQFLKKYPTHPLYNATRTLHISALYHDQQYEKALELAAQVLNAEKHSNDTNLLQRKLFWKNMLIITPQKIQTASII